MSKTTRFYMLMSLAGFLIILLPVGIANMIFGYVLGDSPCTLCWGQREAMIYIGVLALFIGRYGMRPKYIASLLVVTAFGLWQSFAHFGNHAHRDLDQGFGLAVFGIHTYFWAEVVFWAVVIILGILFFFAPRFGEFDKELAGRAFRPFCKCSKIIWAIVAFIVASNAFQALVSTGVPPFYGQGDPVRFSLNPKYIVWESKGWQNHWKKISFLGKRAIAAPDYAFSPAKRDWDHSALNSPFASAISPLAISGEQVISANEPLNTLAPYANGYVASSKWHVSLLDSELNSYDEFTLDPYYSATVDPIIGAKSFDNDVIWLMGSNKTYARVRPNANANESVQWADFLDGYTRFDGRGKGLGRGRIDTVRAKFYHIGAMSSDDEFIYTATTPNEQNKGFVISQISLADRTLSAEWTPRAQLKDNRSLGELYITDMVQHEGALYALSKQFNLIAKIDIATHNVEQVFSFDNKITNARALLIEDNAIKVLSYQDGKNILFSLN